ncbi:MAG: hypothetical protein ACE14Q_08085 [Acidobacteriota bacterium]|nr:hypothetical protein [Thermoanaerobaculaceae bacterium]
MAKKVSFFKTPLFLKPKTASERTFLRNNRQYLLVSGPPFKDSTHQRSKRLTLKEFLPDTLR